MLLWLMQNWINLALIALLVLLVGLLIRGLIRDRRAGNSRCSGSCGSCGSCAGCGRAGQTGT